MLKKRIEKLESMLPKPIEFEPIFFQIVNADKTVRVASGYKFSFGGSSGCTERLARETDEELERRTIADFRVMAPTAPCGLFQPIY